MFHSLFVITSTYDWFQDFFVGEKLTLRNSRKNQNIKYFSGQFLLRRKWIGQNSELKRTVNITSKNGSKYTKNRCVYERLMRIHSNFFLFWLWNSVRLINVTKFKKKKKDSNFRNTSYIFIWHLPGASNTLGRNILTVKTGAKNWK